ncbi:MAG: o-succinylbenzoate synthase [Microbacterium sp.]
MHLPALEDVLDTLRVVALPMSTRFRGVTTREAALFEGPEGWAEFSPFVEYDDVEAATWLAAAIDFGFNPQPPTRRETIRVNATVPAVDAARVPEVLARYDGCRTVKVKVAERGQQLADDIARVRAVRETLGPDGRIRVDANAGWNIDEAEHALHALAEFDLEYAEQPCASVEELAEIRRRMADWGIPIAADESIRKADDPLRVARVGAADIIIVKAQPLGGVRRALDIVAQTGLPAVVSSALDTSVGLTQGAQLAASLPELDFDCGLGTASLVQTDVTTSPLKAHGGEIAVGRITPDALDAVAAPSDRVTWWRDRVTRCHTLLLQQGGPRPAAAP